MRMPWTRKGGTSSQRHVVLEPYSLVLSKVMDINPKSCELSMSCGVQVVRSLTSAILLSSHLHLVYLQTMMISRASSLRDTEELLTSKTSFMMGNLKVITRMNHVFMRAWTCKEACYAQCSWFLQSSAVLISSYVHRSDKDDQPAIFCGESRRASEGICKACLCGGWQQLARGCGNSGD